MPELGRSDTVIMEVKNPTYLLSIYPAPSLMVKTPRLISLVNYKVGITILIIQKRKLRHKEVIYLIWEKPRI